MTRYRCCKDLVGVIYAVGGQSKSGNSLSTVEVYDPIQGRWKDAEAMSMLRSRVGMAVMQNRLQEVICLKLEQNIWKMKLCPNLIMIFELCSMTMEMKILSTN